MRCHFLGKQTRTRSAIEQDLFGMKPGGSHQPMPHDLTLTSIVPVFAFDVCEVRIFFRIHVLRAKTLFCPDELSKVKCMQGVAPMTISRQLPRPVLIGTVIGLLLLHFSMAVGSKLHESTTADEIAHVTSGVSYWLNDDYRLQPENGVLPQRWAALPWVITRAKFPKLTDNDDWVASDAWLVGHQFFYESGVDHFPRLMAGRAMIALFSVATGFLIFYWSRRLFGDVGGVISLVLYTFCPTFLAHGALATSDMCMVFFFLAASGAWWWHLHDGRMRIWLLSAIIIGLAFTAKFSALLLVPMMVLTAIVRATNPQPLSIAGREFVTPIKKLLAAALSAAGQGLVAAVIIWALYGFRYSAFNPALPGASFLRPWSYVDSNPGVTRPVIHALIAIRALPEAFIYGLGYVLKSSGSRAAFLNGNYSTAGWHTFFPWAFVLKTTLPVLLIVLLVGGIAIQQARDREKKWRRFYRVAPLAILFIVYWLISIFSHLNIGQRHLMPTYPVIFIAAGAMGTWFTSRRYIRMSLISGLIAWHIFASVSIAPHYLAYFNSLGGGPKNGWHHLVDSSLDWGQDLPTLKTWLDAHADKNPVYLAYFGTGEPNYYKIKATTLPCITLFNKPPSWYPLNAGIYCISVTALQQVYTEFQGNWRLKWEQEYQQERVKEPFFREYFSNSTVRENLRETGFATEFENTWKRYDQLRFARLCCYLRARSPDGNAGHSILIYRLTENEVAAATTGPLSDLANLIEKTAGQRRQP